MNNLKENIKYTDNGILSKVLIKNEKTSITLFCMGKETDIGEHTSTKKGIVYVVEGDGIFTLEGKEIKMTSGVLFEMDENAKHSIKAIDNTSFLLVLIN